MHVHARTHSHTQIHLCNITVMISLTEYHLPTISLSSNVHWRTTNAFWLVENMVENLYDPLPPSGQERFQPYSSFAWCVLPFNRELRGCFIFGNARMSFSTNRYCRLICLWSSRMCCPKIGGFVHVWPLTMMVIRVTELWNPSDLNGFTIAPG